MKTLTSKRVRIQLLYAFTSSPPQLSAVCCSRRTIFRCALGKHRRYQHMKVPTSLSEQNIGNSLRCCAGISSLVFSLGCCYCSALAQRVTWRCQLGTDHTFFRLVTSRWRHLLVTSLSSSSSRSVEYIRIAVHSLALFLSHTLTWGAPPLSCRRVCVTDVDLWVPPWHGAARGCCCCCSHRRHVLSCWLRSWNCGRFYIDWPTMPARWWTGLSLCSASQRRQQTRVSYVVSFWRTCVVDSFHGHLTLVHAPSYCCKIRYLFWRKSLYQDLATLNRSDACIIMSQIAGLAIAEYLCSDKKCIIVSVLSGYAYIKWHNKLCTEYHVRDTIKSPS